MKAFINSAFVYLPLILGFTCSSVRESTGQMSHDLDSPMAEVTAMLTSVQAADGCLLDSTLRYTDGTLTGKSTYQYNENGHNSSLLMQGWDGTWSNTIQYTYTYDGAGNMTGMVEQVWNANA